MFTPWPIGFVSTPYKGTTEVPKGLGTTHEAEGVITVLPDFELGLTDIEGFSHLIVLWEFDRAQPFELLGTPPTDNRQHGVFAPNQSGSPLFSCFDATRPICMYAVSTCWMARRSSTSSPISRASRQSC